MFTAISIEMSQSKIDTCQFEEHIVASYPNALGSALKNTKKWNSPKFFWT